MVAHSVNTQRGDVEFPGMAQARSFESPGADVSVSVEAFERQLRERSGAGASVSVAQADAIGSVPREGGVELRHGGVAVADEVSAGKFYGQLGRQSDLSDNDGRVGGQANVAASAGSMSLGSSGEGVVAGLGRLRRIFDEQATRAGTAPSGQMVGTEEMVATQVEMVRFSLLVDVASKLTGKSAQVLDTLLKGQ